MTRVHDAWLEHQHKRFMRPDAHRYWKPGFGNATTSNRADRPDVARAPSAKGETPVLNAAAHRTALLQLKSELAELKRLLALHCTALKYRPDQPRDDHGRWIEAGDGLGGVLARDNDPRILSDASSENIQPGARYAQDRARGPISVRIGSRVFTVDGGQGARLVEAQARAEFSTARAREVDPSWRPTPSTYETVEGLIRAYNAQAREAQDHVTAFARSGIGAGPFARESIEARSPNIEFSAAERREINRIGRVYGCHTCGALEPGTLSGNFIPDHQRPTALIPSGQQQWLFPHCRSCSASQGGNVNKLKSGR